MNKLNVGIIGGGFTGLSAAYYLSKAGHKVTIIESSNHLGGLASGFREDEWNWSLEEHYHHWFTNDKSILDLASEIHFPVTTYRPKTSILSGGNIYQFDSPLSLIKFPHLGLIYKLRTAFLVSLLKTIPFTKYLERITAKDFLIRIGGHNAWDKLWGPLFKGKFGKHSDQIPAIWFWARIKKRTPSLMYPDGGYKAFIDNLNETNIKQGVTVLLNKSVNSIEKINSNIVVSTNDTKYKFDKVISTLPINAFISVTRSLSSEYLSSLQTLEGIGAVTLVLSLKNKFFKDNTYWLSINEKNFPFLAVVEHTNMVGSNHYNNEHILYVGNYVGSNHKYFDKSANELVNEFEKALKRINPKFNKSWINKSYVFKSKFAQPIVPLNYSHHLPKIQTPIDGLYLATMQQVYPWDRGTNYAVELGRRISDIINI